MEMQNKIQPPSLALPDLDYLPPSRALFIEDETAGIRNAWLQQLEPGLRAIRLTSSDDAALPPMPSGIPVLVLHAQDPMRLVVLLQANVKLLSGRIKIALCTSMLPVERALLLRAGFDDVFDVAMAHEEACARISAMHWRQSLAREPRHLDVGLKARVRSYATHRLGPREYEVLALLAARVGQPVSVEELATQFGCDAPHTGQKALQVQICRLRKKLKPDHAIQASGNGSYMLTIPG